MLHTSSAHRTLVGQAIAASQEIAAFATKLLLKSWGGYSAHIQLPAQLPRTQRYIVVGNHQSQLDPFVIFALMPFRLRRQLLPLKFMTIPKIYHQWFIKPFAYLLGCYPAHIKERHHHTYGVGGTIRLLQHGYNICLFPEGKRTLQAESAPKSGIVSILQEYHSATLLIAHLEWTITAKGKRHVRLVVAPAPSNLDTTDAKAIMNSIYAL